MSLPNAQNIRSTLCLFPLPHQVGAPYFDGKDVTDFLIKWEDLTLDWSDDQRIKKIPLYSDKLIGRYLKTWPSYTGADCDQFKDALLKEFKDDGKSTVFYRTPAPIIVYYFPYITCLLYLLFLIKHVRTSG